MCQHLVQNQFTSDAFQGARESYMFQWDTNVWDTWPQGRGYRFCKDWNTTEGHINYPRQSYLPVTTQDQHQVQQDTPAYTKLIRL